MQRVQTISARFSTCAQFCLLPACWWFSQFSLPHIRIFENKKSINSEKYYRKEKNYELWVKLNYDLRQICQILNWNSSGLESVILIIETPENQEIFKEFRIEFISQIFLFWCENSYEATVNRVWIIKKQR